MTSEAASLMNHEVPLVVAWFTTGLPVLLIVLLPQIGCCGTRWQMARVFTGHVYQH
jgi:hypothetical protein